jgi:superfamily I DNA/RNA helicase
VRALLAGELISEQDFRRLTETFPSKAGEVELFTRGTKAKWKKLECSQEPLKLLEQLTDWGAGEGFAAWLRSGEWRTDMYLQIDTAAERWGMDLVRKPRIRAGTVHSVKGMEARVVLCMAASTAAAAASGLEEETCLQYVAVTRASGHYRLVVDQQDLARGNPVFWAAPEGFAEFDRRLEFLESENARISGSEEDPFAAGEQRGDGLQTAGGDLFDYGDTGPGGVLSGEVSGDRGEETGTGRHEDSAAPTDTDQEEWWDL